MVNLFTQMMPWAVLLSNILAAVLFLALLMRRSFGGGIVRFVGEHALAFGLLFSAVAVGGSLFYSNVVGFPPCYLCWWQRIVVYPLLPLFLVAVWKRDRGVFRYAMPLSVIALILSLYHSYVQWGGSPLIPCDVTASCSKLYVYAFGYITIPTMVLSIAVLYMLLYWSNRVYQSR